MDRRFATVLSIVGLCLLVQATTAFGASGGRKGGRCPAPNPAAFEDCASQQRCQRDAHCPGKQKCCSGGCGLTCKAPVRAPSPNASCPPKQFDPTNPDCAAVFCRACNERSCNGSQKCCAVTSCCQVCTNVV